MLYPEGEQPIDIERIKKILSQIRKPAKQYKKGWNSTRAAAQRERCLKNKPWEHSTGARTPEGKKIVGQNAFKHGLTSIFLQCPSIATAFYKK